MTHTPTPWTLYKVGHTTDQVFDSVGFRIVADCKWTKFPPRQREVNAAHIVHCVNTYPALYAALKDLLDLVKANELVKGTPIYFPAAEAALKQATGAVLP